MISTLSEREGGGPGAGGGGAVQGHHESQGCEVVLCCVESQVLVQGAGLITHPLQCFKSPRVGAGSSRRGWPPGPKKERKKRIEWNGMK